MCVGSVLLTLRAGLQDTVKLVLKALDTGCETLMSNLKTRNRAEEDSGLAVGTAIP